MKKRAILTIVAFTLLVLLFPGFIHGAIPASERAALIALYNSTDGYHWNDNSGWKTPPLHTDGFAMPGTEGSWKGIMIEVDHVIGIDLNNNQLSGSPHSRRDCFRKQLRQLWLGINPAAQQHSYQWLNP